MEAVLRARGYSVIVAENGESGLEILKIHAGSLDLLLSDIVLPKLSGPDLADQARSMRPGIRVLHTSGYTDRGVVENGLLRPGTAFLQKPFTAEELARKVRAVLDSPA
jgi:CheY-like chemotaxis protein